MPRPPRCRTVRHRPVSRVFGPKDHEPPGRVVLPLEGLEAIRLFDQLGMNQEEAAESMGISRQTFGRVLAQARNALATALLGGLDLVVEGGSYEIAPSGSAHPTRGLGRRFRCGNRRRN